MERRILPIGIQSFSDLRARGCLYVDKTAFAYRLASEGKTYFLSRPRRFGKSLFVSTLEAYLSGRKDLFAGLAIEKLEEAGPTGEQGAWTPSPVIKLDFNAGIYDTVDSLREAISYRLTLYEKELGLSDDGLSPAVRFDRLIKRYYEKTGLKVVVLVDEYDKPLLENLHNEQLNSQMRRELKAFYGVLKSTDDYTRFVFITGVTKFSHVSIFSDLNQLRDISMLELYNDICGMSTSEIQKYFQPELQKLAVKNEQTEAEAIQRLTQKYDGYCFSRPQKDQGGIYNPFSLINCLSDQTYDNYWFSTGTPTFLVEMMKETRYDVQKILSGVDAKASVFTDYRIDMSSPIPLFYQSGYLTIKAYDKTLNRYRLASISGVRSIRPKADRMPYARRIRRYISLNLRCRMRQMRQRRRPSGRLRKGAMPFLIRHRESRLLRSGWFLMQGSGTLQNGNRRKSELLEKTTAPSLGGCFYCAVFRSLRNLYF